MTEVIASTAAGLAYQPISYTVTTNVGGITTVMTATQPVQTYVITSDGTVVTRYSTPPPLTYTTTIGGIETTEVIVTTPTGATPVTLTFVSTSGGTLTTITSTFAPTTRISTKLETLTTVSTPSPTSSFSTKPRSTETFTSTSSIPATTTTGGPSQPSVTTTTKVFSWDEADLFLGTFLPTMLAVMLVVPLRIIDLNAKLYQPFQTLTENGGAAGSDSRTLEYSGLAGFITPFATLLQGRPVPFITTVFVACASITIPLSAEAISLKIHGTCMLTTGSKSCAVALGISPAPANVLIGILVSVILMLLLLLFLLSRWKTGVYANPWNIAGIASLSRSSGVRIGQLSERAMRQAVSQKQYVLGHFEDDEGREEYGIILADESGRALHDAGESEADGISLDGFSAVFKGVKGSGKYLPFITLRYPWRIAFFLYLTGLFIFILYYHSMKFSDNRLWRLMNAYSFGTRFIFAAFGVLIAFCWQSFFLSKPPRSSNYALKC